MKLPGRGRQEIVDLVGQPFGDLTVEALAAGGGNGRSVLWLCRCSCGQARQVFATALRRKRVTHCGCKTGGKIAALKRAAPGHGGFQTLYTTYKHNAARRGLAFELTERVFLVLTSGSCQYCRARPSRKATSARAGMTEAGLAHSTYTYNGIDRVDNSVGYLPANCVPCCTVCNRAKGTMPVEEFVKWAVQLVDTLTLGDEHAA